MVRGAITSGELDIYPEYTGNGAFFFKDENDAAWKNAQQGYEKVKKLDAEQNKLIWLTPAPANNTGPSPCVRMWQRKTNSLRLLT